MTHNSIRILVVEDHHVVRQGLVALLSVVDGVEVVAPGRRTVQRPSKNTPHISPDIDPDRPAPCPSLSGVEVIQRSAPTEPQARFIVLTTYDGDEDICRALQAGGPRLSAQRA